MEFVDEWTTILLLDDFLKRYPTMKVLQIEGYDKWLSKEKVENGMEVIIRKANKLCDLKHILEQESSNMNNLAILHVRRCHNLINLVPSSLSFQNLTTRMILFLSLDDFRLNGGTVQISICRHPQRLFKYHILVN